ncbi:efflux RND transporter periplasmic adaptor subunit [Pedomonas sp. V897]|uniref:efflux RND transporter periplasmic adaptor subunit n=1 Tax=Pedomonas sp. V897 TaxID=3446482 RepID=UPI003EE3B368
MPSFSSWRTLALAPLALAALLAGCKEQAMPTPGTPEVGVVALKTENVTVANELPGRTAAFLVAEVRPQVSGIIQKRLFEEGSMVKAGEPLYQIDPSLYEAARNEAEAQLASARANLAAARARAARYDTLKDSEAVSRQDIDDALAAARQAEAAVKQAEARLATAKINLAYTQVAAPISGRIGRSSVTAGALVTASQANPLAIVQQLDPIYVDITQSSAQLLQLRRSLAKGDVLPASTKLRLKLEDGTDYPLEGKLEFAETIVDENTGTVTLRARFPNPDGVLLPGMFVRVVAPQAVVPNAILAPQQGVTRDAKGDATALVVTSDGKVEQRTITAERAIGDKWLVTSGLKAGDRLIVEGTDKVRAGQPVKPVLIEAGK